MKKALFTVIIAGMLLIFIGCFSPYSGDEGTITISFGGSDRAADWPPSNEVLSELVHRVTLKGPGGNEENHTIGKGKVTAKFTVVPGQWQINVVGFYNSEPYAGGLESIEVKGGQSNSIRITMEKIIPITSNVNNLSEWEHEVSVIKSGGNDKSYIITLGGNVFIPGITVPTFGSVTGIAVTIQGSGISPGSCGLTLNSNGSLLYIGANQKVTIEDAQLVGQGTGINNNTSLVMVNGGAFTMNSGLISSNTTTVSGSIGGVYINNSSIFTMNSGKVSDNTGSTAGGVYINNNSIFTMNGGEVSGNIATANAGIGGVYVRDNKDSFYMNGGVIYGNTAAGTSGTGGVESITGTFRMTNGIIVGSSDYIYGGTTYTKNTGVTATLYTGSNNKVTYGTVSSGGTSGGLIITSYASNATIHVIDGVK